MDSMPIFRFFPPLLAVSAQRLRLLFAFRMMAQHITSDRYSAFGGKIPTMQFDMFNFVQNVHNSKLVSLMSGFIPLTLFVFCVALRRFCLQPFPGQFNRFVKFLLQQFAFRKFCHVFGYLDAAFT